jgi:hypothetical protein
MKKGGSPARAHLVGKVIRVLDRDKHDDAVRMSLDESPGGFEAIHVGHVNIHQDEIRVLVIRVQERLPAGCNVSEQLKPGCRRYHGSGCAAKSRLVIDDHHSDAGDIFDFHTNLRPTCASNLAPPIAYDNRVGR